MNGTEATGASARTYQITSNHVLIALLAAYALLGFTLAYLDARRISEPHALQLGSILSLSLLTFAWFWLDSEARAYKRSPLLNVAVVGLAVLAVPYYLLRSRPKGQRLKAVAKCIGFVLLLFLVNALGTLPVTLLMR